MFHQKIVPLVLCCQVVLHGLAAGASFGASPGAAPGADPGADPGAGPGVGPADRVADGVADRPSQRLLESLHSEGLREVVADVLARNPKIARAEQLANAAALRAPQVRALPDPVAAITAFALPAETRVGPQRLSASIQQRVPWFGTLALQERIAVLSATAARAEVEAFRLDMLTEARRIAYELAFLDAEESIVSAERETLVRYEGVSQARYASGTGLQQEVVRIQAQITRSDTRLLEIAERRAALESALNALRDRPADEAIERQDLPQLRMPPLPGENLRERAALRRPELAGADATIAIGSTHVALAEKRARPEVTFGLSYTLVDRRDDALGRVSPPAGNGDDILALSGSLNLPVRRRKLEAAVEEAHATKRAAEESRRGIVAGIAAATGDLTTRISLLHRHLELLEEVLFKQAREALRSTETAYSTGKLNAVDLLDAEVVLFEVQIAGARTRADLAVAMAQLERTIAGPLAISPDASSEGARADDS